MSFETARSARAGAAVIVGFLLAIGSAPVVLADDGPYPKLPGEPDGPTSQDVRYLSTGEAANAAYDFAKGVQNPETDKLVDTTVGVISTAYPPAGIVLGFAWGLIKSGRASVDPVGDAIKLINTRLDGLKIRVDALDKQVNALQDFTYKQANINRMRELKDRDERLRELIGTLKLRPNDQFTKDDVAQKALLLVNRYLDTAEDERDLWTWNDRLHVYSDPQNPGKLTGKLLPAAFNPMPTLEYYVATLAFFMTVVEAQANGNTEFVRRTYGATLLKHASLLSVRPYWRELDERPSNDHLPEWLMAGVSCEIEPVSKYGDANGQCSWRSYCDDQFALKYHAQIAIGTFQAPTASNALCTLNERPPRMVDAARRDSARQPANLIYGTAALDTVETNYRVGEEEDIQRRWGLEAMTVMADHAARLARVGTVREPYVGRFDMTTWKKTFLYGVNPVGELTWMTDMVGADRNGPQPEGRAGFEQRVNVTAGVAATAAQNATVEQNATIAAAGAAGGREQMARMNPRRLQTAAAPPPKWLHQADAPRVVGTGWQSFTDVFPAWYGATPGGFGLGLFALTRDGVLKWYRHDGFADGSVKWAGPVDVGTGWNSFQKVFAGGEGVMYGIGADGALRWYRYEDAGAATRPPRWRGPTVVGSGWGGFVDVFSGGQGVIYAVRQDGALVWYRHVNYATGVDAPAMQARQPGAVSLGRVTPGKAIWEGPKVVGSGWQNFRKIFSPGDGFIYAINANGEMLWYFHEGFQDGSPKWQGPMKLNGDWSSYGIAFPLMWGAPQATVVR